MRVVGDKGAETAKKLAPLLILPPPGLTYEYLETLEALTISERRVAFCLLKPAVSLEALSAQAVAALDALESPKVHVCGHGTGAAAALALQAAQPTKVASLTLASPITNAADGSIEPIRELLARGSPAPLLIATGAANSAPRACVDSELSTLKARPGADTIDALLQNGALSPLSDPSGSGSADLLASASVGVPLLLTRGSKDVSSEAVAQRIALRVPTARIKTFEGSASLPHVDDRSGYNTALLDFLDEVDGVASRRAIMMPGSMQPGGSIKSGAYLQPSRTIAARSSSARSSTVTMLADTPPGGDLERGKDPERNAQLEALKRSFLGASAEDGKDGLDDERPSAAGDAAKLGLYLDLPLCRWGFHILPHHRTVLNVFQPQYTLMFEKLLATPQPWFYGHVYLEGGVENLDNPDYALKPGSKAPLTGTLMQVVAVQRESDSRLTLIVQGLARGIVVRPTQDLPFARADMQILPDDEMCRACARRSRRFLEGDKEMTMRANNVDVDGLRRRLVMAAATAEERYWNEYENANISLSVHQSLSQVVDPLPNAVLYREAVAVTEALESAPMAPAVCYGPPNFDKEASEEEREAKAKEDTLYSESKPVLDALDRAIEAAEADAEAAAAEAAAEVDFEAEEAAEEAEDARALASLETQVWLELDLLLRTLAKLRAPGNKAGVPSQLLGLLPPAPEGGWPDKEFDLENLASQLRERYDGAKAEGEVDAFQRNTHYVPIDHERFPPRRRAQRLSYAIWGVIGGQGVEYQPLLDESSTSDRLRKALLRMRDVMRQISP